jgi:hypothetical protein
MATSRSRYANLAAQLERLGGGSPRMVPTAKMARQFIFPNGMIFASI